MIIYINSLISIFIMLELKTIDLANCEESRQKFLTLAMEIADFLVSAESRELPREVAQALQNLHLSAYRVADSLEYWRIFRELFQKPNSAA